MTLLIQVLREALENIRRNKSANILCLGIICFTLLVLGIFRFVNGNLGDYIKRHSRQVEAVFYLQEEAEGREVDALLERIRGNLLVSEARLVTAEEARARFNRDFPELQHIVSEYRESPFPTSIEVRFKEELRNDLKISAFIEEIQRGYLIESMEVNIEWINKLVAVKRFVSLIGFFLTMILLFVSTFIIFNVIRLIILFRREEIQIMQLVGATRMYIKVPFLIEGSLLGFFGGALAVIFLVLILKAFPVSDRFVFNLVQEMIALDYPIKTITRELLLVGTSIGLVASWFSVDKHIR